MERSSLELALKRLPATSYRQVAVGITDTRKKSPKTIIFIFVLEDFYLLYFGGYYLQAFV